MNATTISAKVEEFAIESIDLVSLFDNALKYFENEINDAERVINFTLNNTCKAVRDKSVSIANMFENGRATLLHDKIKHNDVLTVDSANYYKVKNTVRNYAFPWVKQYPVKAAKNRLKKLKRFDKSKLDQPTFLSFIELIEFHVGELGRYFYNNPKRISDEKHTKAMALDCVIPAVTYMEMSGGLKVVAGLRSLNQEEILVTLRDGLKRLSNVHEQASQSRFKILKDSSYNDCDFIANQVGFLKSCLVFVKYSGKAYDKREMYSLEQSLYADAKFGLTYIRDTYIKDAENLIQEIEWFIQSDVELSDEILLGYIWRMQNRREVLKDYINIESIIENMHSYSMNTNMYSQGSARYNEVKNFVKNAFKN